MFCWVSLEAYNLQIPKNKGQRRYMLWEMLNAARDLGRVHAIASVLSHYGFGGFVRSLGMGSRLDHYVNNIDNAISRLTMGIVTAALIIGSSIIMTVKGGPELFGLPAFGFLGYTFAMVGGVWLLFSIWRSGK